MLVAMLAIMTIVSQFHRSSLGVIAPELIRDLALSPQMLGLAGGAFFLVLVLVQLPLGVLLDRVGPRRLIAGLTGLAVLGALLQALASSGEMLVFSRLIIGLGCSASFMGAIVMCARWFEGARLAAALSWVFALSQLGNLLAASPLALASEAIGWRWAFGVSALLTGLAGALFWWLITTDHPSEPTESPARESMLQTLRGIGEVLRTPGLGHVLAIQTVAYATVSTLLGVWAGPYLFDVHGLDPVARGHVIAAMVIAQVLGVLACGPLDAWLNTRKWIVVVGALATVLLLAALALWPSPPVAAAVILLVALCAVASFGVTLVAHGRSLFPDRLAGRGMTTLNLAQVVGSSAMPLATGALAAFMSGLSGVSAASGTPDPSGIGTAAGLGAYPEAAYRAIFALLGLCLAAGLAAYARGPDSRPRPAG